MRAEPFAGCGAELDFLLMKPSLPTRRWTQGLPQGRCTFAAAQPGRPDRLRFLSGAAVDVLPPFIVAHDYDLVVIRKPPHGTQSALDSLAGRVLTATAGDVVLMDCGQPIAVCGSLSAS